MKFHKKKEQKKESLITTSAKSLKWNPFLALTCGADFTFTACQLRLWIRCAIFADFPFFFSVQICMEMLSLRIFATDLQQNPQLPIFNTWIFALSAVKICNTKSTLKSALFHVFSADFTHCESGPADGRNHTRMQRPVATQVFH